VTESCASHHHKCHHKLAFFRVKQWNTIKKFKQINITKKEQRSDSQYCLLGFSIIINLLFLKGPLWPIRVQRLTPWLNPQDIVVCSLKTVLFNCFLISRGTIFPFHNWWKQPSSNNQYRVRVCEALSQCHLLLPKPHYSSNQHVLCGRLNKHLQKMVDVLPQKLNWDQVRTLRSFHFS